MEKVVQFPGLGLEFTFHNSIQIGPFQITYYGIIIALGMLLAMVYAYRTFRKAGVDPDKATDAILGGIIGGIIGARLYFVIFSWKDYGLDFSSGEAFWNTFSRIFKTWEGGMAIYGGIIGALLVGVLIAKWRKIHIPALLDVVGVGFLLGQGIGRWGNFFNVEAFGDNTSLPWGMTGPDVVNYLTAQKSELAAVGVTIDPTMPVHPTFLYESLWCLLGFVLLALYMKHRKFDGEVFLMYLGYYGLERSIVEGLRTDSLMIGTLRVSQLLAIVLVLVSVIMILVTRSRIKNSHDENYMKLYVKTEIGQRILNKQNYDDLMPPKQKKSRKSKAEKSAGEITENDKAAESGEETDPVSEEPKDETQTEASSDKEAPETEISSETGVVDGKKAENVIWEEDKKEKDESENG